jgi:hypothetical protein
VSGTMEIEVTLLVGIAVWRLVRTHSSDVHIFTNSRTMA